MLSPTTVTTISYCPKPRKWDLTNSPSLARFLASRLTFLLTLTSHIFAVSPRWSLDWLGSFVLLSRLYALPCTELFDLLIVFPLDCIYITTIHFCTEENEPQRTLSQDFNPPACCLYLHSYRGSVMARTAPSSTCSTRSWSFRNMTSSDSSVILHSCNFWMRMRSNTAAD